MTDLRLSQFETLLSVVRQAHADDSEKISAARARLIDRCSDAIQRYLVGCLRTRGAVDKVCQKLALRFVRGSFFSVSANKGRCRGYIRTVIYYLVADFGRRKKKYAATASAHESMLAGTAHQSLELDEQFQTSGRDSLLGQGWETLRKCEKETGKAWYTVLKSRSENPQLRSPELAELVSDLLGKEVSSGNMRVLVHRARERFAEILIDLNLWQYCKPLLQSDDKEGGP